MKIMKSPSAGALIVTKTLCLIFGTTKPLTTGSGKDKVEDWWGTGKKHYLNAGLLKLCQNIDRNNLKEELIALLRPII